jgi:hypothetical protein
LPGPVAAHSLESEYTASSFLQLPFRLPKMHSPILLVRMPAVLCPLSLVTCLISTAVACQWEWVYVCGLLRRAEGTTERYKAGKRGSPEARRSVRQHLGSSEPIQDPVHLARPGDDWAPTPAAARHQVGFPQWQHQRRYLHCATTLISGGGT